MNTKKILIIVTLVTVISLLVSGCSGISYAAAPKNTPKSLQQIPTSATQPTKTAVDQEPLSLSLTQVELEGTWFYGNYIVFQSTGSYRLFDSLDALQKGDSLDDGQYGLQGNQHWLGPMSRYCNGMGLYQVTSKQEGEIEFTMIREECSRNLGKLQKVEVEK
jgi:hypothetical protein